MHVFSFEVHFPCVDEMHRVKLWFQPSGSNYINASYIDVRKLMQYHPIALSIIISIALAYPIHVHIIMLTYHISNLHWLVMCTCTHYSLSHAGLPTEARVHSHSRSPGAHHWRLVEDGGGEWVQLYRHALYPQGGGRGNLFVFQCVNT